MESTHLDKPSEHFLQTPQRAFFEEYAKQYWKIMADAYGNGKHSDYLAAVDQKIKEFFESSQLWYRVHPMTIKEVLKSDKPLFKTVYETGTTGGVAFAGDDLAIKGFQRVRRQLEFMYLGCSQDMDPAKTPLSVYMTDHSDGYHLLVGAYGSVAISLKKEIRKRTFGILGDSYMLGIGAQLYPYPKAPDWADIWLSKSAKDLLWPGLEKKLSLELAKLEQETPDSAKLYALPTPLENPTREYWPMRKWYRNSKEIAGRFLPNWENPCDFWRNHDKPFTSYAEGLIDRREGPVTINDIEEVVFHNPRKVDDEMKALLKEHGVSYRYASNVPLNPGVFLDSLL